MPSALNGQNIRDMSDLWGYGIIWDFNLKTAALMIEVLFSAFFKSFVDNLMFDTASNENRTIIYLKFIQQHTSNRWTGKKFEKFWNIFDVFFFFIVYSHILKNGELLSYVALKISRACSKLVKT